MGGEGRGSALELGAVLVCSLLVLHCCEVADAATHTVGDLAGWTFNIPAWSSGKKFKAGDILVFTYSPAIHDVAAVDKAGYQTCTTPAGAKLYKSGKDKVKLVKGPNYFICNVTGHCQAGMKLAVTAA